MQKAQNRDMWRNIGDAYIRLADDESDRCSKIRRPKKISKAHGSLSKAAPDQLRHQNATIT